MDEQQGAKGNWDLGLSVQFFGVISDRNELPETKLDVLKMI